MKAQGTIDVTLSWCRCEGGHGCHTLKFYNRDGKGCQASYPVRGQVLLRFSLGLQYMRHIVRIQSNGTHRYEQTVQLLRSSLVWAYTVCHAFCIFAFENRNCSICRTIMVIVVSQFLGVFVFERVIRDFR